MDEDIYSGFTLAAAKIGISAILTGISYAKLHIGVPFDGTMHPSAFTTRQPVTYGAPDANGVYDFTAPFSFASIAAVENTWGLSFWTAVTGGTCLMTRQFSDMKYVFVGDTLTVVSAPVFAEAVDL